MQSLTIRQAIIGSSRSSLEPLTRQIRSAALAAGGTALSLECLDQLVIANSDEGQTAKTFIIKAAAEDLGGTSLSTSCLYNLVKNNWQ